MWTVVACGGRRWVAVSNRPGVWRAEPSPSRDHLPFSTCLPTASPPVETYEQKSQYNVANRMAYVFLSHFRAYVPTGGTQLTTVNGASYPNIIKCA
jgi:hypothetical protein